MKQISVLFLLLFAAGNWATSFTPAVEAAPAQSKKIPWPTFRQTTSKKVVPEVKAIQFLLRARGFYPAQPDGIYGPQTASAVKAFQRKSGLTVDGIVGPATFPKLTQTVKRGARGDTVRAVQILLRDFGGHEMQYPYADLKVDGIFGYNTESAVRDYQDESQVGGSEVVKVNGVMNTLTWALFFHAPVWQLDDA